MIEIDVTNESTLEKERQRRLINIQESMDYDLETGRVIDHHAAASPSTDSAWYKTR